LSEGYARRLEGVPEAMGKAMRMLRRASVASDKISSIVFSRDRPLQLHALISSYLAKFDFPPAMEVLYSVSDSEYLDAYEALKKEFVNSNVRFLKETNFREDLLNTLRSLGDSRVFFLVDDIVFIRPVTTSILTQFPLVSGILSLRLGPAINYSYTRNANQRVPEFTRSEPGLLTWDWEGQDIDWGYPFSVDGHVFWAPEILTLAEYVEFQRPNSFESAMQFFSPYFASRRGYIFEAPRLVNIPCNRVQDEIHNIHGELHQAELLSYWKDGLRIDYEKLADVNTNSCHQELPFSFRTATARSRGV
ncbi:MAG: hypothetical protein KDK37_10800, partial [Leptospiraceae bacterium]|nr:hypothetical protein [Leptospiraceae bacterium]